MRRHKGKKTAEICEQHFVRRFAQRYDIWLSSADVIEIKAEITAGRSRCIWRQSNSRALHEVDWKGHTYEVVYDKIRAALVTVLPPVDMKAMLAKMAGGQKMTTRVGDDSELLDGMFVIERGLPSEFDPKTDVDITGLEPADVLLALHQNTTAIGMGRHRDKAMTPQEAMDLIQEARKKGGHFDYVFGRPIKVSLVELPDGSQSWLNRADLYDRTSKKPARNVVAELRAKKL